MDADHAVVEDNCKRLRLTHSGNVKYNQRRKRHRPSMKGDIARTTFSKEMSLTDERAKDITGNLPPLSQYVQKLDYGK